MDKRKGFSLIELLVVISIIALLTSIIIPSLERTRKQAREIINQRLKKRLKNDGKQTPWSGSPIFVAQHATATCCRNCIQKWYRIPKNIELNSEQIKFIEELIATWIFLELEKEN